MWKDLSKLEKAGLVIGGIECVAGFGIAIYSHIKCNQHRKRIQELKNGIDANIEFVNELTEDLKELNKDRA